MDFCYIIQPISHFGTFLHILVDVIFFNHHPGSPENPIIIDDDLDSIENSIVISDEVHDDDGYVFFLKSLYKYFFKVRFFLLEFS